ncbi:MAG: hypothetical protein LR001_00270 [Clostridiales bacterium]|nr:hypothetical protein [Clostridiales bacterium]
MLNCIKEVFIKDRNTMIARIRLGGNVKVFNVTEQSDIYFKNYTREEIINFLQDRMPPKDRRDIEKILARLGLRKYNILDIGLATKGISTMDNLWISTKSTDTYKESFINVMGLLGSGSVSGDNSPLASPSGVNKKRYYRGPFSFGIAKQRLSPMTDDIEMEVLYYRLSLLLGVDVCTAYMLNEQESVSEIGYDIMIDYIVHARYLLPDNFNAGNLFEILIDTFPSEKIKIYKMIILDFITRQDDRHMSNLAFLNGKVMYPLYDNGRCLFYEDRPDITNIAYTNVEKYATSFGAIGTYADFIKDINADLPIASIVDLYNIRDSDLEMLFDGLEVMDFRKVGAIRWMKAALTYLDGL